MRQVSWRNHLQEQPHQGFDYECAVRPRPLYLARMVACWRIAEFWADDCAGSNDHAGMKQGGQWLQHMHRLQKYLPHFDVCQTCLLDAVKVPAHRRVIQGD